MKNPTVAQSLICPPDTKLKDSTYIDAWHEAFRAETLRNDKLDRLTITIREIYRHVKEAMIYYECPLCITLEMTVDITKLLTSAGLLESRQNVLLQVTQLWQDIDTAPENLFVSLARKILQIPPLSDCNEYLVIKSVEMVAMEFLRIIRQSSCPEFLRRYVLTRSANAPNVEDHLFVDILGVSQFLTHEFAHSTELQQPEAASSIIWWLCNIRKCAVVFQVKPRRSTNGYLRIMKIYLPSVVSIQLCAELAPVTASDKAFAIRQIALNSIMARREMLLDRRIQLERRELDGSHLRTPDRVRIKQMIDEELDRLEAQLLPIENASEVEPSCLGLLVDTLEDLLATSRKNKVDESQVALLLNQLTKQQNDAKAAIDALGTACSPQDEQELENELRFLEHDVCRPMKRQRGSEEEKECKRMAV